VSLCVVLLKLKLWILSKDLIYYGDNDSTVGSFIYCLLVLLPKEPSVLTILSTYRPLKHLSNLSLIAWLDIILIIYLRFSNFACNPYLCMSPRLCPCLITLKNLIPLLICLVNVL
jgi:hypothetical protein